MSIWLFWLSGFAAGWYLHWLLTYMTSQRTINSQKDEVND